MYWIPDMRKEFFTGNHLRLALGLALPVLLLFSMGTPLVFLLLLLRLDRQQPGGGGLHDGDDKKRKNGYAYRSYR